MVICFTVQDPGHLVRDDGIKKKEQYTDIISHNLKQSVRELNLGRRWSFTQVYDPKNTSHIIFFILNLPWETPDIFIYSFFRGKVVKLILR